ncbi:MAG: nodulation protein NfeD [Actinobacteria bacterium]|nr:nodulation protein NfeD [Actinomycetota bacterium]
MDKDIHTNSDRPARRRPARRRPDRAATASSRRRYLVLLSGIAALVLAIILINSSTGKPGLAAGSGGGVRMIPVEGVIDPPMADYVIRSISDAEQDGTGTVVLRLDTPGGLDTSMRDIIKKMADSPLPVVTWVAPTGSRAASAGTFIVMASDAAAMASGTNLGAAHPVAIGADLTTDEGIKVTNDAAAYIRALAETNGRNANWAELAVRQSVSLSADDALSQNVIDFKADTQDSLLTQLDGFTTKAKNITLSTKDASVSQASFSLKDSLLHLLLDPNIAYLLFIYGLIAIIYEFVHPGIGIGGVSGTIALMLSFYALYMLPVNFAGVVLVVVGMIMLAAELFLPSHGALSVGGVASLILGSFFLFDSSAPFLRVSWPVNVALALFALVFFAVIARKVMQARRLPKRSSQQAMIGEIGTTRSRLDPLGQIFVRGEIWSAEAPEGEIIEKGVEVEVTDVRGLMLKVKQATEYGEGGQ